MNTKDTTVTPFADQMEISLFDCLYREGYPTFMFTEQHRMASGLEEISARLVYFNKIGSAPSTAISQQPLAQGAIDFVTNVHDGIPHVCLNIPDGVCMRSPQTLSRFIIHNIVAIFAEIRALLTEGTFTSDQITIETPYCEQAQWHRDFIAILSKDPF